MSTLNVNGKARPFEAENDTPLLWVLREQLGLTGTKYGCGIAQCGACSVHIDGVPTRSCVRPASSVKATEKIVTIEGWGGAVAGGDREPPQRQRRQYRRKHGKHGRHRGHREPPVLCRLPWRHQAQHARRGGPLSGVR